jgi:hypothetical protein
LQDLLQVQVTIEELLKPKVIPCEKAEPKKQYRDILEVPSEDSIDSPYNYGLWTMQEKARYVKFVDQNIDVLSKPELCYKSRIFTQMASYIGTRSAKQCRAFHR